MIGAFSGGKYVRTVFTNPMLHRFWTPQPENIGITWSLADTNRKRAHNTYIFWNSRLSFLWSFTAFLSTFIAGSFFLLIVIFGIAEDYGCKDLRFVRSTDA